MSYEAVIFSTLEDMVSGRVYPDIAPEGTTVPYITYQQVGGVAVVFLDTAIPGKSNARVQVNVWGSTRIEVSLLAGEIERRLRLAAELQTSVLGAPVSLFDEETALRGSRQDFSFWY